MEASSRVIINTIAQYSKTIINALLALYSTRLILQVLGVEDFGIYSLLAGVISMLAFATNALATTTQRFLSFHQGKSSIDEQKDIFANSLFIHIALAFITLVCLLMFVPMLFNGFLNISEQRLQTAIFTYHIVALILFTTFLSTPFRAVLVSHENIVYLTIIDVIDGILKVCIAIGLNYITFDKLVVYAWSLLGIQIFNLLAISSFSLHKYEECIIPKIQRFKVSCIREISFFASWNIYNVGCIVGRTQGIAIVINKFYGTTVNAAYGLGFQIASYTNFMSEALLNALRPQMIRLEGKGERKKMLWLSEIASKYSFFLLSCLTIPCIFEMPSLLVIWLGDVPENAVLFCRMVLIACLVDSLTCGLGIVNQAIGNLKQYSLAINSTKLITLLAVYICVKVGLPIMAIAISYIVFEFLCAMLRIPFIAKTGNLNSQRYIKNVFGKELLPFMAFVFITATLTFYLDFNFVLTFIFSIIAYLILFYLKGITLEEKVILYRVMRSFARVK